MAESLAVSFLLGLPGAVLGRTLATDWKILECTAWGHRVVCVPGAAGNSGEPPPSVWVTVTSFKQRVQWFLVFSQSCATIIAVNVSTFLLV